MKLFDKFIYVLIILNLLSMIVESEPYLDESLYDFLRVFERFSIAVFTIEYLLRTFIAFKNKSRYNLTFFGLIDLIAILPFYITFFIGFDGRFIRVLRLFRISRIIKLGKFNKAFELLGKGIHNVRRELYLTFFIAFIMLFFSASGIYYLENPHQPEVYSSIIESFWWAVASLTGVGFEEVYPVTTGGKVFGTIISLIGIGIVAVPTGIISASFVELINDDI